MLRVACSVHSTAAAHFLGHYTTEHILHVEPLNALLNSLRTAGIIAT